MLVVVYGMNMERDVRCLDRFAMTQYNGITMNGEQYSVAFYIGIVTCNECQYGVEILKRHHNENTSFKIGDYGKIVCVDEMLHGIDIFSLYEQQTKHLCTNYDYLCGCILNRFKEYRQNVKNDYAVMTVLHFMI